MRTSEFLLSMALATAWSCRRRPGRRYDTGRHRQRNPDRRACRSGRPDHHVGRAERPTPFMRIEEQNAKGRRPRPQDHADRRGQRLRSEERRAGDAETDRARQGCFALVGVLGTAIFIPSKQIALEAGIPFVFPGRQCRSAFEPFNPLLFRHGRALRQPDPDRREIFRRKDGQDEDRRDLFRMTISARTS